MRSKLDAIYRTFVLNKFFNKGWGGSENLKKLFQFRKIISNRKSCYQLIGNNYRLKIVNLEITNDYYKLEGTFESPFAKFFPDLVPQESHNAFFEMLLPTSWIGKSGDKPICIHLGGTGDHYFWRRREMMAKPLLRKAGIGAIILENPFYGFRRPEHQVRSNLCHVSDIFVMGGCLVLECLVLLKWCERHNFGPLGVTGISMGGHMAALAASAWPKPLVLVPCLSGTTASAVFTEGVMSESIDWELLKNQYYNDPEFHDLLKLERENYSVPVVEKTQNDNHIIKYNPSFLSEIMRKLMKEQQVQILNDRQTEMRTSFISQISSYLGESLSNGTKLRTQKRDSEVVTFMKFAMDECTHLKNYSEPFDKRLCIFVSAQNDAYVPKDGCPDITDVWKGVEVRLVKTGHIGAYIWHLGLFRDSIIDAFKRVRKIYPE